MAQSLDEQIAVIERALGECMIDTALVVVRAWLNEIGENNPYEEAFVSLQTRYRDLFTKWLNIDDPADDEELNKLTGDAYQLVDAVYAEVRIKRGLSPEMHGFNPDSIPSVMQYFQNCVRLRPEDLEWLHEVLNDEQRVEMALVAAASLGFNLRTCFSVDAFLALIDGINANCEIAANMCLAQVMMLLVQYDVRIDFFPQIQDAFVNAIAEDDGGENAFGLLCTMIRSDHTLKIMPQMNDEYLSQLIPIIPQTWLYALLVENSTQREHEFAITSLVAGCRDFMWDYPEMAERVFLEKLRDGANQPMDYINYAHCLLMRGDRMMAYENYKQARQLCGSSKEFFNLFRPDRRMLVDHGVPMEHVYLLEDKLLERDA